MVCCGAVARVDAAERCGVFAGLAGAVSDRGAAAPGSLGLWGGVCGLRIARTSGRGMALEGEKSEKGWWPLVGDGCIQTTTACLKSACAR